MSTDTVAILGFVALFALMLLRVPVGMAMGLVGVTGFGYLVGFSPALKLVGQTSMADGDRLHIRRHPHVPADGTFVSNSGMSRELFRAANGFVGHLRGGVVDCHGSRRAAALPPICGSSVATAATFSAVAYPEMRRFGYPQSFATGVIAARRHAGRHAAAVDRACGIRHHHRTGHRQAVHRRHHSRHPRHDHVHDHHRPDRHLRPVLPAEPVRQNLMARAVAGLRNIWAPALLFVFVNRRAFRAAIPAALHPDGGRAALARPARS